MTHPTAASQPPMRETFAGKHLLVTGVTGFLGKVWVGMTLTHLSEVETLTLLVRKSRKQSAQERVTEIFERSPALRPLRQTSIDESGDLNEFRALIAEKIRVVEADIGSPLCGLTEDAAKNLMQTVDAVVHFAGVTDFAPDPLIALSTNSRGAVHVADLAALSPSKRMVHCSTAFVAGLEDGEKFETLPGGLTPNGMKVDPLEELNTLEAACKEIELRADRITFGTDHAQDRGYPNLYTFSKGLGELLLEKREDIDLTVLRPSIVESAQTFPMPGWNEGINTSGPLVWLLSTWFRRLPADPENYFDVVPVDEVSKATLIAVAASLTGTAAPVYQAASGSITPLKFERAIDLTALAVRRLHQDSEAKPIDRFVLQFLDAVPRGTEHDRFPSWTGLIGLSRSLHKTLSKTKVERLLPPALGGKGRTEKFDNKLKDLSGEFRQAAKSMVRIEQLLETFKPFIYDHSYLFDSRALEAASAALHESDQHLRYAIDDLDWRNYWINIHAPGLKKWCFPLLRGEKAPLDPAPYSQVAGQRTKSRPKSSSDEAPRTEELRSRV